jgi:hypothetical protein
MCLVRPVNIICNVVSLCMMRNSYLKLENTLCLCLLYLAEPVAVSKISA